MATKRFLTAESGVEELLKRTPPLHFRGTSKEDWRQWREVFSQELIRNLGPRPDPVSLEVEILESVPMPGYTREKIIFNSDSFSSVPAYVLIPDGASSSNPRPAVLCAHGHGVGKDGLVGVAEDTYQKQFPIELTRQGFVTIAPDWRGFGERTDRDEWVRRPNRDGCNVAYLALGYFGYQLLHLDICDAQRCLDYLQSRPDVDGNRLGCMGCSFGGTMTTYVSALDQRIKAAVIVCYLSTLTDALNDRGRGNTCGSQFMFGLRRYGDISDVAGLIAPRPCMAQIASNDTCFIEDDALEAFRHLQQIYRAAGAEENLQLDNFEGVHEIDLETAVGFLKKHLCAST
ncbi:MAG: alpha/beta hydrolase [Candidatus Poribacteria bacterium]